MGYDDIVRGGVATIKRTTSSLQVDATLEQWNGNSASGARTYATAATYSVLEDRRVRDIRLRTGDIVTSRARVTFLEDVAENGTAGRREPVDPRDRLTLSDGTTGPILDVPSGLVDPDTNRPYLSDVWLG